MPIELTEADLVACGKIQETKNTTIAKAKEIFRKYVAKLANPDVEGRADLVLENVLRAKNNGDMPTDVMEDEPVKKTKKAKVAKTPKVKAEKKAKAPKQPKAEKVPRLEVPIPELTSDVELKVVTDQKHVYTASVFGKKHAVLFAERRRNKAGARFQAIGFSDKHLSLVFDYAKEKGLPVAICAAVRVNGKADQGYVIPYDVFDKFQCKEGLATAVNLRAEARLAYETEGWAGVKFNEAKAEKAAA